MKCTCRDSTQPCPACQRRIDAAESDRFFEVWDEGHAVPPGGEQW